MPAISELEQRPKSKEEHHFEENTIDAYGGSSYCK